MKNTIKGMEEIDIMDWMEDWCKDFKKATDMDYRRDDYEIYVFGLCSFALDKRRGLTVSPQKDADAPMYGLLMKYLTLSLGDAFDVSEYHIMCEDCGMTLYKSQIEKHKCKPRDKRAFEIYLNEFAKRMDRMVEAGLIGKRKQKGTEEYEYFPLEK